jgi:hypothetical protein
MKVWKSPVFYFGIVLVLAVVSALLAPFVVDWGRYRIGLEEYGEKLTGRKVEITGPISVRFFPWPRLTAGDVEIANPEGAPEKWFVTADQVVVQMTLGALLNGTIQVESIDVQKPVIKLRRNKNGVGNWKFEPAETIRNNRLLEHVMLDQITVSDGTVQLIDDRRGGPIKLENLNGTFSAPNLAGPWRSSGTFGYDDLPLAFSATTGVFAAGAPLHLGLRVSSQENVGYSYFLDGETDAKKFTGGVRLEPVADPEGKGDTEGQIRPVTFKSKVVADFENVDLSEIEIRPADVSDQGTLLAGSAKFSLGKKIQVAAELSAPRADLDSLAGAESRRLLRDGGGLSLVNSLLTKLPHDVDLRSSLKIAALKAGGETLENALLDVSANRDAIRIHELSASLPGRSRSRFEGVFFPGAHYAELAGNLAVESADTRALSTWIWPDSKADIVKIWSGNRGHLKAKTDVTLTASKLELANIAYELDGEPGNANFKVLVNGERPIVNMRIDTPNADIDSYLSGGFTAVASQGGTSWLQLLGSFVEEQVKRDLRLTLRAGSVRLNGVEAKDVVVDVETTVQGFDLKTMEIGSVDGARLSAAGVVLSTPEGPDGEIAATVTADDPRGFLHLAGLLPRDKNPAWTTALGKTDLKISLKAKPSTTEPTTGFSVNGMMGEFTIASDGSIVPALDLARTAINGSAEINSTSSAALVNLYGGAIGQADAIPARLVLTADGNFSDNFLVDVTTEAYRSAAHFAGKLNPMAAAYGMNGDLTFKTRDAKDLLTALQIPSSAAFTGALTLGGKVVTAGNKVSFDEVEGKFAGVAFAGFAAVEDNQRISGDFSVDQVSLTRLMAPVFLPWNGKPSSLEQTFAKALPLGLTGEVWVRPKKLTVYPGLDVGDAQIGLTASADNTRLAVHAKTGSGEKVAIDLASKPGVGTQEITGHVNLPVDLKEQLKLADGTAVVSGAASVDVTFDAKGLSPGGALATLNATGNFTVGDARLLNISPQNFSRLIVNAKDAGALQDAFTALHHGEGVGLGGISGGMNIVDGVATLSPFATNGADADILIRPAVELATGYVDLNVLLHLKAMTGLPAMEISYVGAPAQLVANEDATALTSFLGFKVLEQGVGDLEKLQAEQQRLALEEEKLRKTDQEKLDAFYAQKAELRLRLRELRIQADQRVLDATLANAEQARLIQEGVSMNRLEIKQRLRELKAYRKAETIIPIHRPKPRPVEVIQGPVVLVPPGSAQ